jgi:hypothetical protein
LLISPGGSTFSVSFGMNNKYATEAQLVMSSFVIDHKHISILYNDSHDGYAIFMVMRNSNLTVRICTRENYAQKCITHGPEVGGAPLVLRTILCSGQISFGNPDINIDNYNYC